MKRIALCALAVGMMVASAAQAAQERVTVSGYLPPMDRADGPASVSYILCPEPWLEMVEDGTGDDSYDEAWHCAPVDYTCAHPTGERAGYGCGFIPDGWQVPATAPTGGFRSEIMEHVIVPCLMDSARRQDLVDGLSPEDLVSVALAVNPQMGEDMTDALMPLLSAGLDWSARKGLYDLSRQTCINAARAAD